MYSQECGLFSREFDGKWIRVFYQIHAADSCGKVPPFILEFISVMGYL